MSYDMANDLVGGAGGSADTLVYDSEKIRTLASDMSEKLGTFNDHIEEMFTVINTTMNSPEHWQGQAYSQFATKCNTYREKEIADMVSSLQTWISSLERIADSADDNTSKNVGLFS